MGNSCSSCDTIATCAATTAKVIFPDGHLQEYAGGDVRVSHVLSASKDVLTSPCFLCNADDMEFEGYVSAVRGDARLRPGQIYFVLPTSVLRRRLRPEEMASLAVRASAALVKSGARVVHVGEPEEQATPEEEEKREVSGTISQEQSTRRRTRRRSGGRGCDFTPELGAIEE